MEPTCRPRRPASADLPGGGAEGPKTGNLDRIQVIKAGSMRPASRRRRSTTCLGDAERRKVVKGKLAPVGSTVDLARATWTNTIGDPELIGVWTDPDFDPSVRASTTRACSRFPRHGGRPTTPRTSR